MFTCRWEAFIPLQSDLFHTMKKRGAEESTTCLLFEIQTHWREPALPTLFIAWATHSLIFLRCFFKVLDGWWGQGWLKWHWDWTQFRFGSWSNRFMTCSSSSIEIAPLRYCLQTCYFRPPNSMNGGCWPENLLVTKIRNVSAIGGWE